MGSQVPIRWFQSRKLYAEKVTSSKPLQGIFHDAYVGALSALSTYYTLMPIQVGDDSQRWRENLKEVVRCMDAALSSFVAATTQNSTTSRARVKDFISHRPSGGYVQIFFKYIYYHYH